MASPPSPHQQRWTISKGFKDRADDDPFDYPFVSVEGPDTEPVEVVSAEVAERLEAAITNASYCLDPNQGERPDPAEAYKWLRTTYPKLHPNYVDPTTLRPGFTSLSSPADSQEQGGEDD